MQQPDGERAAGAQSGARREIGVVMDFETLLDAELGQDSADRRVLDVRDRVDQLDLRIDDAGFVFEERWQPAHADVAIFIDGSADDRAAVFAEPGGVVGSPAKQRNSKRSAADDHEPRSLL